MSDSRRNAGAQKKSSMPVAKVAPAAESSMRFSLSLPLIAVIAIGIFALLVAIGYVFTAPIAVLLLAALALVGVISFFWSSLRTLLGETRLSGADAYAIGAPRLEEEQKRAVLRALKDLEFERAVGKISDDDYRTLAVRYREDAKRLLRLIDVNAAADRERAQGIVTSMLIQEGLLDPEGQDLDALGAGAAPASSATATVSNDDEANGEADSKMDDAESKDLSADADDSVHAETKEAATRD